MFIIGVWGSCSEGVAEPGGELFEVRVGESVVWVGPDEQGGAGVMLADPFLVGGRVFVVEPSEVLAGGSLDDRPGLPVQLVVLVQGFGLGGFQDLEGQPAERWLASCIQVVAQISSAGSSARRLRCSLFMPLTSGFSSDGADGERGAPKGRMVPSMSRKTRVIPETVRLIRVTAPPVSPDRPSLLFVLWKWLWCNTFGNLAPR